jgi:hypothetical protein
VVASVAVAEAMDGVVNPTQVVVVVVVAIEVINGTPPVVLKAIMAVTVVAVL